MSGNTQQTAEAIAKEIGADIIRIEPVKEYPSAGARKFIWGGMKAMMGEKPPLQPYDFSGEYDRIIIGTPVWASSITPPLRTFITENKEKLKNKRFAVFTCYSGGGAEKAIQKLKKLLEIESFEAELILTDPKDQPKAEDDAKIREFSTGGSV